MNEAWYWKLGFSVNPFTIKPALISSEIIGHRMEPILEKIEEGHIQFIEAPLGSGKTTMLKSIIRRYGGRNRLIYCNCIGNERLNIADLLKNSTLKGKIFGVMPKDSILMVDEAQDISVEDLKEISERKAAGEIMAVTFFGTKYDRKSLTEEINKSLNGNVTVLSYLTPDEAVQLIRLRVGNLKLLPDYVIREIYGRSNGNPRRLLQYCETLCKKAIELSISEITVTDVGTLLNTPEISLTEKKSEQKSTAKIGSKPKKRKPAKKRKKTVRKNSKKSAKKTAPSAQNATVTYSGYDLNNIRTYEEEMGTLENPKE